MKTMKFYFPVLLIIMIIISACKTDEIDTPTGVKIRFQAKSTIQNLPDSIIVTEAYFAIAGINFYHAGNADTTGTRKIVHYGPYTIDIVKGTISPAVRWIFIDPGVYDQISLISHNSLPGNYSLIIKGMMKPADQSDMLPFEIHSADAFDLKVHNTKGIQIRNNENLNLLIEIDIMSLFVDLDFQKSTDGKQNLLLLPQNFNNIINNMSLSRISQFSSFRIDDGKIPTEIADDKTQEEEGKDTDNEDSANNDNDSGQGGNNSGNSSGNNNDKDKESGKGNTSGGSSDSGSGSNDNKDDDSGKNTSSGNSSGSSSDDNKNTDDDIVDEDDKEDEGSDDDQKDDKNSDGGTVSDDDDDENDQDSGNNDSGDKSDDNSPDDIGDAPGKGNDSDGTGDNGNAPGKGNNDNGPGNSGNAPGNNKNNDGPGNSGNAPGNNKGSNDNEDGNSGNGSDNSNNKGGKGNKNNG